MTTILIGVVTFFVAVAALWFFCRDHTDRVDRDGGSGGR